jgi:pimeloyl-ACP methyl ester carboxylesterase
MAAEYRVIMPDQRNHGQSFHDPEFNYSAMSKDVFELIRYLDLPEAIILGHSMGGKVAMNLAMDYPQVVKKLIVADIGPKFYPVHHQKILAGLKHIDIDSLKSRSEADRQLANYVEQLGIRQFLLKNLDRNENGGFRWKINLPVIDDQIENVGEEISQTKRFDKNTQFVRGGKSDYILEDDFLLINKLFPNNQIDTIADAGHWLHAERPAEFIATISSFIKSN